jgi:hypothetical protein
MCKFLHSRFPWYSNSCIAFDKSDVIAITVGVAGLGATIVGNIIAYYSLKALQSKGKSPYPRDLHLNKMLTDYFFI